MLTNPGFECKTGTYQLESSAGGLMRIATGWTPVFLNGAPWLYSTRMQFAADDCDGSAHVERMDGEDSQAVFAQDIEWSAEPGKPFDVALYQQTEAVIGAHYSLSGWMLSLCGGSTMPNDCPDGFYMAKMLGIDPTGGTDPAAETVVWAENRRNFVENGEPVGWQNLQVSAVAQSETITVFGRVNSPFRWHGNHAFIDAFLLVNSPTAQLGTLPDTVTGAQVDIEWMGDISSQIREIPAGRYTVTFDVEFKVGETGEWQPWQSRQPAGSASFVAESFSEPYFFRVRAFSEQPEEGPEGAFPNHRFLGVWSEPVSVLFEQATQPETPEDPEPAETIPVGITPTLINPSFECKVGTYQLESSAGGLMRIATGWTPVFISGTPWLYSTRMFYAGDDCDGSAHVERIDGEDSQTIRAPDIETPPEPGKPFDVALYQQVTVTPGAHYSLSAWMLSLCGGSAMPNDCPDGFYMAKMLGIDPTGGTDPTAETVIWAENRRNFTENGERVGWQNLQVSAVAQSETITVFGRINSPFRWHGNHAFIDAFLLLNAPTARLNKLPTQVDGYNVELRWQGDISTSIRDIPAGRYVATYDIEYRLGEEGEWQPWQSRQPAGRAFFESQAANLPHFFRVRAFSEQPEDGPEGAFPNHRFLGVWSEPVAVTFSQKAPPKDFHIFIPTVQN
ncbi:MAG: hypothetical protein WAU10_07110 [Caldilineaceae bacterium]